MRDIELIHIADTGAVPPEPVDNAYVRASAGGVLSDTALVDPSFADTREYGRPSLGGDFGIGRAAILGADADGGAADLGVDTTVAAGPPDFTVRAAYALAGRAANNTSFLNLFPWHKTPPEGLDQNNPNPPAATVVLTPHNVTIGGNTLSGNTGNASFSGPASRDAVVRLTFALDGGADQTLDINIASGDTGSQIAAKVRNIVDAFVGLDASGTGGTVTVIGIGGLLTGFNFTII